MSRIYAQSYCLYMIVFAYYCYRLQAIFNRWPLICAYSRVMSISAQ